MKKHVFSIVFSILFVGILVFQYSENYKFRIKPPSEEWSKEVLIGSVNEGVKTYPKMLNYLDKSYLIAYQNGGNIRAEVIDKFGKKKNEIIIPGEDKFIRCLNLISDGENTYINWITSLNSVKTMHNVKIDRNLKIIEQNQEKDVQETIQIGDSILVSTFKDKIVLMDIKNNISTEKKVTCPALVSGVNTDQGYLITYHEDGRYFKYFFIKDGVVSDVSLAAVLAPDTKGGYFDRTTLGSDNKYAYLMVEAKTAADRYGIIKCITFSLDGEEHNMEDLKIGSFRRLFGSVAISSGDEARFIASCTRNYERKDSQEDIIDFTFKNGEIIKYMFASRTNEPSMYPALVDNNLIFFNYLETDKYNIYMASMDNEFKNIHNVPRNNEKSRALTDTFLGFVYSIIFIFLFGLKWILSGLTGICGFSYFAHAVSIKAKKFFYVLSYLLLVVIKVSTVYSKRTEYPDSIKSPFFIIGSCVFISMLCLSYGYRKYKKDMEILPLWSYVQAMFIDTILTQMIFIPYIY